MASARRPRLSGLPLLALALLLALNWAPPLFGLAPPLGYVAGAQVQGAPSACQAVGNNWTSCDSAFVSDDAYAFANATREPAQFARPDADVFAVNWTDSGGDSVHFDELNETSPDDDASYTQTAVDPDSGDDAEFNLTDIQDPQASDGHILRYRYRNNGTSGGNAQLHVTVELREGNSVIAAWSHLDITSTGYVTRNQTLSAAQTDLIGNYSDLRIRLNVTFIDGSQLRQFRLTWVEFEVPGILIPDTPSDTAWSRFGLGLSPSNTVKSVEIGVEWFRISNAPILNVTVSWNGGLAWAANQTAANKTADDNLVEWLNFTSNTTWDAAALNDSNFRVRLGTNSSGARLDYVTVRVNYNPAAPWVSEFRLEDGAGVSQAGEWLDVGRSYRFLFSVTDEDGWSDIGSDGYISLRLWYDGNVTPELIYGAQTNGSNYRIELRYADTLDPGNATVDEWRVSEGSATYSASASTATAILNGSLVVGFAFNLSVTLGYQVRGSEDPTNGAPGGFNDPDSWNAEILATDADAFVTHRTAVTGEHMEFGVFPPVLLAYDTTTTNTTVLPGGLAIFRASFNHSGQGEASSLWVNVTLPSNLTYVTDDAASIGGIRNGSYNFTFSDVAPGAYAFNLSAVVDGGVANGTTLDTNFSFQALDSLGRSLNESTILVSITVTSAVLDLELVSSTLTADPGDFITLNASVENVGSGAAQNFLLEATVHENATYLSSFPTGDYDEPTRTLSWMLPLLSPGEQVSMTWTIRVNPGTPDLELVNTSFRVAYEDTSGTSLPPLVAYTESTVQAPAFSPPPVMLDRNQAERGDEIEATVYYNNTGTGTARNAWLNWSLGGHFELVSLPPPFSITNTPGGFNVPLTDVTPGSHAVTARLRVLLGLQDGFPMGLQVRWEATDGNGNPLPDEDLGGVVQLLAPSVSLVLEVPIRRVAAGSTFQINVSIQNAGGGPGTGWLNLSLPAGFRHVADNGTFSVATIDGSVVWRITSIPAGGVIPLGIELQANGEPRIESVRLSLDYTDGKGTPPTTVLSGTIALEVFGEPIPAWLLWLALALPAGGGLLAFFLIRRRLRAFNIEEVFVIANSGILVAHLSRTLTPNKDRDILAGMLKAVQDFVMDAFSERDESPMRRIEFGRLSILIERGVHHWVAVVFQGKDHAALATRISVVSQQIAMDYGDVLESWTGDMSAVRGIRDLLNHLWRDEGLSLRPITGLLSRLRELWPHREKATEDPSVDTEEEAQDPAVAELLRR